MIKVNIKEYVDQAEIMLKKIVKEFDKRSKIQTKLIKGKGKLDSKKDLWNFALVKKLLMQN